MKIVYLHGFGSTGQSLKSDMLKKHFGENNVFSPDLNINPNNTEELINTFIKKENPESLVFVGTSLGGFWANYFGQKWDAPSIIVNPAPIPSINLLKAASFAPDAGLTRIHLLEYANREMWLSTNTNGKLINMFLAADDELLDYEDALIAHPYTAFTCITPDGGHRYVKHWNEVIERVDTVLGI